MSVFLPVVEFTGGVAVMIWGADRFASGSVSIAHRLGVRPILIGLTVVALATSAPEILVSAVAALHGEPDLAIGNAIGSNIVNIGLVLGMVALLRPIPLNSATVGREMPLLLAVSLLTISLFLDGQVSRTDGFVLLSGMAIVMLWLTHVGASMSVDDSALAELRAEAPRPNGGVSTGTQLVIGLAALLLGAELLVQGATEVASQLGVSEVVVGIVLVALGTSLPELAVSIVSALKGEYGLMIGNIVGSNIFNTLAVVGVASAIQPAVLPSPVLSSQVFVMVAFTLVLFASTNDLEGKTHISRIEGFSMLIAFAAFEVYTVASSSSIVHS